jgi:uncharacterized membrane protein required for colicin V production
MYLDLLLLFIVLFFAIMGFVQGFLKQALSLTSILCIFFFAQPLAELIKTSSSWLWVASVPHLVIWAVVSLAIMAVFMLAGILLSPVSSLPVIKGGDRWLGVGAGLVKGLIIAFIASTAIQMIPSKTRAGFKDFNKDSKDSLFVRGSAQILEWESLASIRSLSKIKKQMAPHNDFIEVPLPRPWTAKSQIDTD